MATLTKRRVKGHSYDYLVESQRINGQPRLVMQKYLGRAEDVVAQLEGKPPEPQRVRVAEYGGSQALFRIAERLGLVDLIDAVATQRDQGLSVGTYILLAVLNRVLAPCSKVKLVQWFRGTALYHQFAAVRDADLTSQRVWDHMGYLTVERIREIETRLTQHMVQEFGLDLSTVVYDATNFYTWMNTNTASELAQRGHQKQHRNDLRAIGLGIMVTTDFNIPLFHTVYPGNRNDAQEFHSITEDLVERYHTLREGCGEVTLIYDKGNNSKTNQTAVDASPFSFVGSLKTNQAPELLEVPRDQYPVVPEFPGLNAYRTTRSVFGAERTVVVTYNEALYLGQGQGEWVRLRKLQERLHTLQKQVVRSTRRPTVAQLEQRVAKIVTQAAPPIRSWVKTTIVDTSEGAMFTYAIDHQAFHVWGDTHWGKTLLFTDHDDWSTADIVTAYRDAWHVEHVFRDMKCTPWLHWQPQFHWTDDKIRVHGFICVLAVTLAHLLQREYARQDLKFSGDVLLRELTTIEEVLWVYPDKNSGTHLTLTERSPRQQQSSMF